MGEGERKSIIDLLGVMAALRSPVGGCPWDLAQDYQSIAPYTLEEAYEVADAIERGDLVDLQEELGDLLFQVVFHARMAEEEGAFDFGDVVDGITSKMLRRHPHVFGDKDGRTIDLAAGWWERIKAEEKATKAAARSRAGDPGHHPEQQTSSLLDDVPIGMPALTRAVKLQDKAANVGFDWPSLAPVLEKMKEELAELEESLAGRPRHISGAPAAGDGPAGRPRHTSGAPAAGDGPAGGRLPAGEADAAIEEEFGDLMFVMANVARHLKIDPEAAMRKANDKFTRRFRYIEARLAERGTSPAASSLEEMDALWDEVRAKDKA